MGAVDLPVLLLVAAGVALAVALAVLPGKTAARLMYAASRRHHDG